MCYVPIAFTPSDRRGFGSMYANGVVARLKPGGTVTQANADTRALVQANAREIYPAALSGLRRGQRLRDAADRRSDRPVANAALGRLRRRRLVHC